MPLTAPQNLVATTGTFYGEIALAWDDLAGATGYNVYRSETSGSGYVFVGSSTTSDFLDTGIPQHSTTYYYVVAGVDLDGEGALSNEDSATTIAPGASKPRAPTGVTAFPGPDEGQAQIVWNIGAADVVSYHVKRATTEGGPYTQVAEVGEPEFIDSGLSEGVDYYYIITADNLLESDPSDEVSVGAPSFFPDPPANLIARTGVFQGQIDVLWTFVINADGYHVYRATAEGGPYILLAFTTVTRYFDIDLGDNDTRYYKVAPVQN